VAQVAQAVLTLAAVPTEALAAQVAMVAQA